MTCAGVIGGISEALSFFFAGSEGMVDGVVEVVVVELILGFGASGAGGAAGIRIAIGGVRTGMAGTVTGGRGADSVGSESAVVGSSKKL